MPTASGTAIRKAVYGKLAGDTASGKLISMLGTPATGYTKSIYYGVAPDSAGFPYVLFNKQSGAPTDAVGFGSLTVGETLEDMDVWLIKAVDRAPSADRAEEIADRIHFLLNDGTGISLADSRDLVLLRRESDVDYGEVIEGVQYRHAGALYRLAWHT